MKFIYARKSMAMPSFLPLIVAVWWALPAEGALIINVGNYAVSAGTPVTAQITVSNSDPAAADDIEGMTFTVQIAGGTGTIPQITSVNLLTGTIWSTYVSADDIFIPSGGNQPQYQSRDLLTDLPGEYVNANGLLATVTINTTGATGGNYAIELVGTKAAGDDSAFLDGLGDTIPASFGQGQITINVPEPMDLGAAVIVAGIMLMQGNRKYRSRTGKIRN